MSDTYDVIVSEPALVAAHCVSPGAIGQAYPVARARRLPATRTAELVAAGDFVEGRYISPDTWYDAEGKAFQPQVHYFVGGATNSMARRLSAAGEDFGELRHHDGSRPPGRSATKRSSRITRGPNGAFRYMAHAARIRPTTRERALSVSGGPNEPRIQQLSDDLTAAATIPSTRPAASCSTRTTCPTASVCAARPAMAFHAWYTRNRMRRCFACVPRSAFATSRCSRAPGGGAKTDDAGTSGHRGGGRARRRTRGSGRHRGGVVRRRQHRQAAAGVGNDRHPNGLANGSDQVGRNYMFHDSQAVLALSKDKTRPSSRRRSASTTSTSGIDDFEFPLGNIQMVGKSPAPMFRGEKPGETKFAPTWSLERGRPARGGLLALHRGPPAARQPRQARARRQRRDELHADQRGAQKRLYGQLRSLLRHLGMHDDHLLRTARTSRTRSRSRAAPTRPAPAASARIPPARC